MLCEMCGVACVFIGMMMMVDWLELNGVCFIHGGSLLGKAYKRLIKQYSRVWLRCLLRMWCVVGISMCALQQVTPSLSSGVGWLIRIGRLECNTSQRGELVGICVCALSHVRTCAPIDVCHWMPPSSSFPACFSLGWVIKHFNPC